MSVVYKIMNDNLDGAREKIKQLNKTNGSCNMTVQYEQALDAFDLRDRISLSVMQWTSTHLAEQKTNFLYIDVMNERKCRGMLVTIEIPLC